MASKGSVYQRKSDGRWVGKLPMPNDPFTGKKQKPKYVYSGVPPIPKSRWKKDESGELIPPPFQKGKQEVERKLEALIKKVDEGDMSGLTKYTLKAWLIRFLEVYCADLATTTLDGYKNYIYWHIIPFMGDLPLHEIRPMHIQNFYNHERSVPRFRTKIVKGKHTPVVKDGKPVPLIKGGKQVIGYSEKTLLQIHRILSRAFSKAVADRLITVNPCDGVDSPSPEPYNPNIYTEKDYRILLDKLRGHKLEIAALIIGMCGLRRGEFAGLDWQRSFDLKRGIIRIVDTVVATSKGNEEKPPKNITSIREFTIPSIILPRLRELQGVGRVFTRLDGKDYDPRSISNMFREFLKEHGLKRIRLHDLRHFNATMMLKNKISDKEAAARLGHSDPTITRKLYQHVLEEMDKENADKLNSVIMPLEAR